MSQENRLVVGISGASGAIYGVRLLEILRELPIETHLVMSKSAEVTLACETDRKVAAVRALADVAYSVEDIGAALDRKRVVEGKSVSVCVDLGGRGNIKK